MYRFLVGIGVLTAMFAILLVLVRVTGNTSANPLTAVFSEVLLPDGQKQACWHGICPGLTSLEEGKAILDTLLIYRRDNSSKDQACWVTVDESNGVCVWIQDGLINSLEEYYTGASLPGKPTMRLGDLVTLWGIPAEISRPFCENSALVFGNNAIIQFPWAKYSSQNGVDSWVLDPALPQIAFTSIVSSTAKPDFSNTTPWHGFILHKGFMPCGGE